MPPVYIMFKWYELLWIIIEKTNWKNNTKNSSGLRRKWVYWHELYLTIKFPSSLNRRLLSLKIFGREQEHHDSKIAPTWFVLRQSYTSKATNKIVLTRRYPSGEMIFWYYNTTNKGGMSVLLLLATMVRVALRRHAHPFVFGQYWPDRKGNGTVTQCVVFCDEQEQDRLRETPPMEHFTEKQKSLVWNGHWELFEILNFDHLSLPRNRSE